MRSFAAIVSGKMILTLGSLGLVPLYLSYWSTPLYGEWLTLSAGVAVLSMLDFGMNMGAINRLTQAYARQDVDDYRSVQRAGLAFYLTVASVGSVAVGAAVAFLPIRDWLGLVHMTTNEAAATAWLLACYLLWAMPSGFIVATYRSTGNLARSQWIANTQHFAIIAATAGSLVVGAGPITVASLQVVILVVSAALVAGHLRRSDSLLTPTLSGRRPGMIAALLKPSLLFALVLVANATTLQGSVLIVSASLGGVAVAMFVTVRTLANVIRQIINTIATAFWPEVTRLEAQRQLPTLRSAHTVLVVVTSAVSTSFAAALWWEGAEVVSIWTRGALTADMMTLRLLLALLVLQSPWLVGYAFAAAANRHTQVSIACLVSSLIGLALSATLVGRFGTSGVVLALIVADLVACCHFVVRDACRLVGEPYAPFARRLWPNLLLMAGMAWLAGWLAHAMVGGPWPFRWLIVGASTSLAAAATAWMAWLSEGGRDLLASRIRPLTVLVEKAKA